MKNDREEECESRDPQNGMPGFTERPEGSVQKQSHQEASMNYREDMEACIEYIEDHLQEEISIVELAQRIHYSVFHFCRIFEACYSCGPMEYVRYRKLLMAMKDVTDGNKVIDVAQEYGYDTPSGFAKAFRRQLGISPHSARKIEYLPPRFLHKESFAVVGYAIHIACDSHTLSKEIAAYWTEYDMNHLEEKLYAVVNPSRHGEYGLCIHDEKLPESENRIYFMGVLEESQGQCMNELAKMISSEHIFPYHIHVPEADYAVFTTPPVDTSGMGQEDAFSIQIRNTKRYIYESWFPQSGYEYDQEKCDFEYYDERCHYHRNSVMDLYIPVRPRV